MAGIDMPNSGTFTPREQTADNRVPPHDVQSEACVLGSMILDATSIDVVVQMLKAEQFYRPAHGMLYTSLVEMRDARKPIDLVAVREELDRKKVLDDIGGVEYLVALVEGVPNAANAEYYATVVRDKSLLRSLITVGTDIVREAYNSHEEPRVVVDRAEQAIFEVASDSVGQDVHGVRSLIQQTFEILENRDGAVVTGMPTQYDRLNEVTCGFQEGEMIILAARPSMGKTSLLLNLAEYIGAVEHVPIAFFSLEMSGQQIAQRLLCSYAQFDMQRMRRGKIGDEDWTRLHMVADELLEAPIYIDDSPMLTITQLRAKARRLKAAYDIKCLFMDYLQLMTYSGRADSRAVQIGEISQGIKALARELEIPVVTAAQLNRGPADRPSHRPRMSDLRESGSIEQDADVVMLLHREDYYHRGEPDYQPNNITELIIAKQRNGPTDVIPLVFRPDCTRFEPAAAESFHPAG